MSYAQAAVDLACALVRDCDRSSMGATSVIPVIVDDLPRALPVLQAVAALTGARWLDTSELDGPVPATSDLLRVATWKAGLDLSSMGSARRVILRDVGSGLVDAGFEPASGSVPSPGDNAMLRVARAAGHGDLDMESIGIILYRESALDLPAKRAAWKATIEWFFDVPHPILRTLIVVVESSAIDVAVHCRTKVGFRYALDDGRLLRRRGQDDLHASVRAIAQHPSPTVFFLGAGFSASSRLPLGNRLRDTAICRLLGIEDPDAFSSLDLAMRFHGWIKDRPGLMSEVETQQTATQYAERLTLEQVVRAEVTFSGAPSQTLVEFREHHDKIVKSPGPAVRDLVSILEDAHHKIVLTGVNFDCLIEENATAPIRVFASDDDFLEAEDYIKAYLSGTEAAIPYLKLHGTIERPETCVMNAQQTERGIGPAKLGALRALLDDPGRPWIYVGASMRDLDLLPVLGDETFARGLDERWVAPFLVETVESFAIRRQAYWADTTGFKTVDERLITETADAFFEALRRAWPRS